jgi:hypothetical protein
MRKIQFLLILLFAFNKLSAQVTESVAITKTDGESINFSTTLRYYNGRHVFPDDSKDYIKGEVNGKKVKLLKKEIQEIKLRDGSKYIVLPKKYGATFKYIIGFYVSQGTVDFFKAYSYGHQSYGAQTSVNKIATESYYIVEGEIIRLLNSKKDFQILAEGCVAFDEFLKQKKGKIKDSEVENAMRYFNRNCQ